MSLSGCNTVGSSRSSLALLFWLRVSVIYSLHRPRLSGISCADLSTCMRSIRPGPSFSITPSLPDCLSLSLYLALTSSVFLRHSHCLNASRSLSITQCLSMCPPLSLSHNSASLNEDYSFPTMFAISCVAPFFISSAPPAPETAPTCRLQTCFAPAQAALFSELFALAAPPHWPAHTAAGQRKSHTNSSTDSGILGSHPCFSTKASASHERPQGVSGVTEPNYNSHPHTSVASCMTSASSSRSADTESVSSVPPTYLSAPTGRSSCLCIF